MNAFQNFLEKSAELYFAAPTFFNWVLPSLFALFCAIVYFAFWLGGKLEDAEKRGLKAQNDAVLAQLTLAEYQATIVRKTIGELQTDLQVNEKTSGKSNYQLLHLQERLFSRGDFQPVDIKLYHAGSANDDVRKTLAKVIEIISQNQTAFPEEN
jgi:hypothetical protein